jgi:hypothetical protein
MMLIRVVKAVGSIITNRGIWYTFTRLAEELVFRAGCKRHLVSRFL